MVIYRIQTSGKIISISFLNNLFVSESREDLLCCNMSSQILAIKFWFLSVLLYQKD